MRFEAGAVGPPHRHPHVQCGLVESGGFDVAIARRTERLSAGDSFLMPPDAVHGAVEARTLDVMRLCSAEIPDVPRIVACLKREQAQVGQACRQAMRRELSTDMASTQASPRRVVR